MGQALRPNRSMYREGEKVTKRDGKCFHVKPEQNVTVMLPEGVFMRNLRKGESFVGEDCLLMVGSYLHREYSYRIQPTRRYVLLEICV